LEAYFGRYLPQLVLACIVPFAVLLWVGGIDLVSAPVMLLTLPLVPVFMWLIGRYTEERTRRRWESLRLLSGCGIGLLRRSASESGTLCHGDGATREVPAAGGRSCRLFSGPGARERDPPLGMSGPSPSACGSVRWCSWGRSASSSKGGLFE
jgi:hypothetical protein